MTRQIGVLGYDGVMALDVVGPFDAFALATTIAPTEPPRYSCRAYALTRRPFMSEAGLAFVPHATLDRAPALDTLIIPGGAGLRGSALGARLGIWLRANAPRCRRIACVCTGIYLLAPTGLLDGRRVTTHWRFAADVARRFPALEVQPDAIYVQDGPFFTSAGVTAGIDLALALIEADHGSALAMAIARELVVYLKRDGGQAQYSEPLRFQSHSRAGLGQLVAWMSSHLDADLSVEALAARACVSARHLTRRFRAEFANTPAGLVETLRLDEARRRLVIERSSIERVAGSVGFQSADVFRRAFERRFGVAPHRYRARFSDPRGRPIATLATRRG
jgi:transcriptional regulator GlxA family with amidase domain